MSPSDLPRHMPDPLGNPVEYGFHHDSNDDPLPVIPAPHVRHRLLLVVLFALFLASACLFLLK